MVALWAGANLALLRHDLRVNPQADLQLITDMFALGDAALGGTLGEFLLTVRKYPLLPGMLLAGPTALLLGLLRAAGTVADFGDGLRAYLFTDPWELTLLWRALFLAAAAATMAWTARVAARLWQNPRAPVSAVALLAGSLLWTLYGTALRPHVPVAAMVTLSALLSLHLLRSPSRKTEAGAFAAATAAFCMLQNGLLAFLFPVWATVRTRGWRRGAPAAALWLAAGGVFSVAAGYPFLARPLLGLPGGFDLELGHNHTPADARWSLQGLTVIRDLFLHSEWLTAAALLSTLGFLAARRLAVREEHLIVGTFLLLYFGVFGVYSSPHPRYFLATFPLLCALGAGGMALLPRAPRAACYAAAGLFTLLLGAAALRPNTYRLAEAFLATRPGTLGTNLPSYLLGIAPTRASVGASASQRDRWVAGLPADLPGARAVTTLRDPAADVRVALWGVADSAEWRTCAAFGTPSGGPGMLWGEIDRPLPWLLAARHLGPVLTAQCRVR